MEGVVDDVVVEIFVRLPSKSVLRCRAVCKRWLRITTEPFFLAEHAARRPREMIVRNEFEPWEVATIDLSPGPKQCRDHRFLCNRAQVEKENSTSVKDQSPAPLRWFDVLYSLDGLLVLQQRRGLYMICNPITRQWTNLPVLAPEPCCSAWVCGFYSSGDGEYRLLCHGAQRDDRQPHYYILSTGSALPRRLGPAPSDPQTITNYEVPVAHRGHLHWFSEHPESARTGKMLAFDTISETFRLMRRPPPESAGGGGHDDDVMMMRRSLLELDGELSVAAMHKNLKSLDIWVLEDYDYECGTTRWTLRHRVEVPPTWMYDFEYDVSVSNVISTGTRGIVLIGGTSCYVGRLYDLTNKMIVCRDFEFGPATPMFIVFHESLVRHAFFDSTPRCPELMSIKFSI